MNTPRKQPTDKEFRAAGFDARAGSFPRCESGFRLLCAWNGVAPEKAPDTWRFYPNASVKEAWERVIKAAKEME